MQDTAMKDLHAKIYVAGHTGLVGSSLVRALQHAGHTNVITRTHGELDLLCQNDVREFFEQERPDYVFLAAAKVGGILANESQPVEFLSQNLAIQGSVLHAAYETNVKRLLFLGSSCIYPKFCPQPILEEYLLTGELEPTNRPYALAKIAGVELCRSFNRQYGTRFLAAMPTNLYGPDDNFDLNTSHVLPALLRKIHNAHSSGAVTVPVWGSGTPKRELLYSNDLAEACVFLMQLPDPSFDTILRSAAGPLINVGTGEDCSIRELAELIASVVGYTGNFAFDTSKPDGTPRKVLNVDKLHELGWRHTTDLRSGIIKTYEAVRSNLQD